MILAVVLTVIAQADTVRGLPDHGKPFVMKMNPKDTIGSVYKCQDRIYAKHDTGVCEIPPHSLKPGKHMRLESRYSGIYVVLKK
jgi:hypothetical protein